MNTKFELVKDGSRGFMIKALRDIPRYNVFAGDLGGNVDSEANLSSEGDCWIARAAEVREKALVTDCAYVGGVSKIWADARIRDCAKVLNTCIDGMCSVSNTAEVSGSTLVGKVLVTDDVDVNNCHIDGYLLASGSVALESAEFYLDSNDPSCLTEKVRIVGEDRNKCKCTGTLFLMGNIEITGKFTIRNFRLSGDAKLGGDFKILQ